MKPSTPKPAVIAYDIACNRRRRKVFKVLHEWRLDGQKSVIECRLNERQAEELMLRLAELINAEEDRLFLAWLDTRRPARARGIGACHMDTDCIRIH